MPMLIIIMMMMTTLTMMMMIVNGTRVPLEATGIFFTKFPGIPVHHGSRPD